MIKIKFPPSKMDFTVNKAIKLSLFVLTLICIQMNFSLALQLEGLSTKKPRLGKGKTVSKGTGGTSLYRVNNTNGVTCILIQTDALLTVAYRTTYKEDLEAAAYLPDDPTLYGTCDEDDSSIIVRWKGFDLTLFFQKTPGGERWYLKGANLMYSTSNPIFEHIDSPGLNMRLSTPEHGQLLFPTPVGKSFVCSKETIVTMYPENENDQTGQVAKLYLRDIKMQAFMYKKRNTWGPPFECSATGSYRDETAPLFTGLTLAFCVIGTISGYGLWRYFKVKKFQYGTMG